MTGYNRWDAVAPKAKHVIRGKIGASNLQSTKQLEPEHVTVNLFQVIGAAIRAGNVMQNTDGVFLFVFARRALSDMIILLVVDDIISYW